MGEGERYRGGGMGLYQRRDCLLELLNFSKYSSTVYTQHCDFTPLNEAYICKRSNWISNTIDKSEIINSVYINKLAILLGSTSHNYLNRFCPLTTIISILIFHRYTCTYMKYWVYFVLEYFDRRHNFLEYFDRLCRCRDTSVPFSLNLT